MKRQEPDTLTRLQNEARAVHYVLTLAESERADAAQQFKDAGPDLGELAAALAATLRDAPAQTLANVVAMLNNREELKHNKAALADAGCPDLFLSGLDGDAAKEAFLGVIADTKHAQEMNRIERAEKNLAKAKAAQTEPERSKYLDAAMFGLERVERAIEPPLSVLWATHQPNMNAAPVGPTEAVCFDTRNRGPWAVWMNRHLGPRGGLTPGRTMIIGGAPGAGKTGLAAVLAVDALSAGCPVLFWQLELGVEETLEHLVAQMPTPGWWTKPFFERSKAPLPEGWNGLLSVPRCSEPDAGHAERIIKAMQKQARDTKRKRAAGAIEHACNGLLIIDYGQLLTLEDSGPRDARHDILATSVSRMAKAASDCGAVLVVLSQLTKEAQKDGGTAAGTAYSGADLARMAHCACTLQKATKDEKDKEKWKACKAGEDAFFEEGAGGRGEARLLDWTKTRGVVMDGNRLPPATWIAWNSHRALHGGDVSSATPGNRFGNY